MPRGAVTLEPVDATTVGDVERLLAAADLPTDDVREAPDRFYIARQDGDRVGVGGLERYDTVGLLRSVVVDPAHRGAGVGTALCGALEDRARDAGITELYLLTTTAAGFFADRGYGTIDRADAPAVIQQTTQFADLCPATATCMRKRLE